MNDKKDSFLDVGQIRVTKPFDPSIAWVKIPPDLIKAEGPTKESAEKEAMKIRIGKSINHHLKKHAMSTM